MVYFLKNKYDFFYAFKRWKALVENEAYLKMKFLHPDNGREYVNDVVKKYCADNSR